VSLDDNKNILEIATAYRQIMVAIVRWMLMILLIDVIDFFRMGYS